LGGSVYLTSGSGGNAVGRNAGNVIISGGSANTTGTAAGSVTIQAFSAGGGATKGNVLIDTTNFSTFQITGLPTTDPGVTDAIWLSSGILVKSGTVGAPSTGPFLPLVAGSANPLSGRLVVSSTDAAVEIDQTDGSGWPALVTSGPPGAAAGYWEGQRSKISRWSMNMGDPTNETGSNAGTDFTINRFADSGSVLPGNPIKISRATGIVTLDNGLTMNGPIAQAKTTNPLVVRDTGLVGTLPAWPPNTLLAQASTGNNRFVIFAQGGAPLISGIVNEGALGSATPVNINRVLLAMDGRGYDGSVFTGGQATITHQAVELWSPTAHGARTTFSTTHAGTATQADRVRIDHDGALIVDPSGTFTNDGATTVQIAGTLKTTGLLTAAQIGANSVLSGTQWGIQGAYIGWNYGAPGVNGEMDFINSHGLGSGGFTWYDVASNAGATPSLLMLLHTNGELDVNSVVLGADPTQPLQAATKRYVDAHVTASAPIILFKSAVVAGGAMTGPQTIATFNIPAGTLANVGDRIHISTWCRLAVPGSSNGTVDLQWGASTNAIWSGEVTAPGGDSSFAGDIDIVKTAANTQLIASVELIAYPGTSSSAGYSRYITTHTENDTAAIPVKIVGSFAAGAGYTAQRLFQVIEYYPA
jgi:hypothetical protein